MPTGAQIGVHLREPAFSSILLSSVNAYATECFGLLMGLADPKHGRFLVDHAVPILSTDAGHHYVYPCSTRYKRVRRALPRLQPGLSVIGDFHSHPGWGRSRCTPCPSQEDLEASRCGDIYIVAAVNVTRRRIPWRANQDGSLSGSVDGFFVKLGAYHLLKRGSTRWAWGRIVCPYALGLGVL